MKMFILSLVFTIVLADDTATLCSSSAAQLSCGQCIKQHPDCAWCRDPHSTIQNRCQLKSLFSEDTCNPNYVYSPVTEMRTSLHTLPLESRRGDHQSVVQIEPQQVVLRMKPGDSLLVSFKYAHRRPAIGYEVDKFQIQTSEYKSLGVDLKFFIECNGKEMESKECPGIQEGQRINFKVKVTLLECRSTGDVALSVGVYGYNTVSAIFITPLCGCECEKLQQQEKNSPLCNHNGDLICGQCVCDPTRGGDKCECPLASYGVRNAMELENQCRKSPDSSICEGKGSCKCGKCHCHSPTVNGRFCQCDHASCPRSLNDQQICSGNGVCECGVCLCEEGWGREDCSCHADKSSCMERGKECSDNGHCECGKCVCDDGYTGAFCGSVDMMMAPETKDSMEIVEHDSKESADISSENEAKPAVGGGAQDSQDGTVNEDNAENSNDSEDTAAEQQKDSISYLSLHCLILIMLGRLL